MQIIDETGQPRTLAWIEETFGPVTVHTPPDNSHTYEITELRANTGPAAIIVHVLNAQGQSLPNIPTIWHWPDAPPLPQAGWHETGVIGNTNENGRVGHAMGKGAFYSPPTQGPHSIWIQGNNQSQMISGLGMIARTNHRHLDVTFQDRTNTPPPPPPPPDLLTLQTIHDELTRTQRAMGRASENLGHATNLLSKLIARLQK